LVKKAKKLWRTHSVRHSFLAFLRLEKRVIAIITVPNPKKQRVLIKI